MTASSELVAVTSKIADFEFRSMLGTEEVGQPFRYDVELLSKISKVTPETMVGSMMTISPRRRDGKRRHFNGYVGTDFRVQLIVAPTEIKLKCGDTTIMLTPQAVTISRRR